MRRYLLSQLFFFTFLALIAGAIYFSAICMLYSFVSITHLACILQLHPICRLLQLYQLRQHCLNEHLTSMLYVYTAEILGTFHPLVTNAAQTSSVVDFVLLSTYWQPLQPPLKMPQTDPKGEFSFPSPTLNYAYLKYHPYDITYASMYEIPKNVDP